MSNLRKYINLVEERTDRFGNPYDPTVNPHAAAEPSQFPQGKAAPTPKQNPFANPVSDPMSATFPTTNATGQKYNTTSSQAATTTTGSSTKARRPAQKPSGTTSKSSAVRPAPNAATKPSATPASTATKGQAAKAAAPAQAPNQFGVELSPEEVKQRQQFLVNLGYDIKVDGIWGPKTNQAYQSAFPQAGQQPTATTSNTGTPDAWTQGTLAKQGQSADIAAAAGMPNPYVKVAETSDLDRIKNLINYKH